MSDNFDLKKYLIENKVTTNSRMLNENVNDLTGLLNKIETILNRKSPDFLYVDELRDCVTLILGDYSSRSTWSIIEDLEEGLDNSPGYTFVTGYGDDIPNALEIKQEADLSLLSNFVDEIDFVLDNAEEGDEDMTETKKKHSKMMKENAGDFFIDFKSEFANYIQDYIEGGADEEVNVVDTNMGIDKWYQYPKTSVLVNHAVKSLQAAGVDSIEKLYAKNNLKYAGESLDEFFQNLKVNETYRGVDFTLIPGVDFSFAEEV